MGRPVEPRLFAGLALAALRGASFACSLALAASCAGNRSTHEESLADDSSVVLTGEDRDDDGLDDALDACPLEAEDLDAWQDEDGCPDPDNDNDLVVDADDLCPLQQLYTDVYVEKGTYNPRYWRFPGCFMREINDCGTGTSSLGTLALYFALDSTYGPISEVQLEGYTKYLIEPALDENPEQKFRIYAGAIEAETDPHALACARADVILDALVEWGHPREMFEVQVIVTDSRPNISQFTRSAYLAPPGCKRHGLPLRCPP